MAPDLAAPTPTAPAGARPAPLRPASTTQISSVQGLRALAALAVVAFHSTVLWHDRALSHAAPVWQNGNAGVDLFFVISGFLMVISSQHLRTRAGGWWHFIRLRLIRVVPLYWLTTAVKLAAITAVPAIALHSHTTLWNSLASFLFLPAPNALGAITPILVVGWTLSFEMLFYAVYATALARAVDPILVAAPTMLGLAMLSLFRTSAWPAITVLADPLVLEFVAGMVLAHLYLAEAHLEASLTFGLWLTVCGLFGLFGLPTHDPYIRVLLWGTSATITLWGALILDRRIAQLWPPLCVTIGAASYSLYLTHGFILPVVGWVLTRSHLSTPLLGVVLVPLALLASTLSALWVHRYVELPFTTWLRRRNAPSFPVSTRRQTIMF